MSTESETGPGLEPSAPQTEVYKPLPGVTVGNFKNHPAYRNEAVTQSAQRLDYERHLTAALTPGPITDLILKAHLAAWDAGWWHDVKTGARLVPNAGEKLMLMVSELCEGAEGLDYNLADDKLPHRKMIEVELADFHIRLHDYCGAFRIDLQRDVEFSQRTEGYRETIHRNPHTPALFQTIRHLSDAMEGHRKKNEPAHRMALARAWRMASYHAFIAGLDVQGAIVEKMAYNLTRPDHQRAARLAEGGKQY